MPNQDFSKDEKVYRFISDPRHKETLSGRVRAACVTCRRKKVKCDGEIPCNTCKDKNVHCEGLTERKRTRLKSDTRRTSDVSTDLGQYSPAASVADTPKAEFSQERPPCESPTRTVASPSALQRPPLERFDTMSSDSGYSSGRQSVQHGTIVENLQQFEATHPTVPAYEFSSSISAMNDGSPDWSFFTPLDNRNQGGQDLLQSGNDVSTGLATGPAVWTDPGSRYYAWQDNNTAGPHDAAHLISAAAMLEEQAQSLRRLASRQINDTRRSTIVFPMSLDACVPAIGASGLAAEASDDMALLFAHRAQTHDFPFTTPDYTPRIDEGSGHSSAIGRYQAPAMLGQTSPLEGAEVMGSVNPGWHYTSDVNTRSSPLSTFDDVRELRLLSQDQFLQTHAHKSDQTGFMKPRDRLHP